MPPNRVLRGSALLVAALVVAGCTRSQPGSTGTPSAPTTTRGQAVTGTVGAPTTFAGLTVTVKGIQDPSDAPPLVRPEPGTRYVRAHVVVANESGRDLSFTPLAQASLIDDRDAVYRPTPGLYADELAGTDVKVGQTVEGLVTFVVPVGRVARRVVFTDLAGVATTIELKAA